MNSSRRIVFGSGRRGGHCLLPEVLEIGWGHFVAADSGHLAPHSHPDAFEICYIVSGEVEWGTADGAYILREGDIYLTQPNELHWGRDASMHPCTLYWLILGSPASGFLWPDMNGELADYLDSHLRAIDTNRLRGTATIWSAFKDAFEEHSVTASVSNSLLLRQGRARSALHSLLIELVRGYDQQLASGCADGDAADLPSEIAHAMRLLHDSKHHADGMQSIRERMGADAKKLNRQFVEHLGTTLSQYWLRERIRLAREQLSFADKTITDVAVQFGFSSS